VARLAGLEVQSGLYADRLIGHVNAVAEAVNDQARIRLVNDIATEEVPGAPQILTYESAGSRASRELLSLPYPPLPLPSGLFLLLVSYYRRLPFVLLVVLPSL